MAFSEIALFVRTKVPTIEEAIGALVAMDKQLELAETYKELRAIERAAEALKTLFKEVESVKHECELVVLEANARIGDEIAKLPKAHAGGHGYVASNTPVTSDRKAATGNNMKASRLQKLAKAGLENAAPEVRKRKRRTIATELQKQGKDATPNAVLKALAEETRQKKRESYKSRTYTGGHIERLLDIIGEQRFGVIYADPAWEFETYSGKGKQRSAERHYDTQPIDKIMQQPVGAAAADNCALLMWCVSSNLPAGLEVIKAWGFEYTTVAFVWIKTTKKAEKIALDGDGLHWGMGYWTRQNAELCLLATKGSPTRLAMDVHQVVVAPVGEHSEKPEEVARRIEKLLPGPYLEINARKPRKGWVTVGNEIPVAEAAE